MIPGGLVAAQLWIGQAPGTPAAAGPFVGMLCQSADWQTPAPADPRFSHASVPPTLRSSTEPDLATTRVNGFASARTRTISVVGLRQDRGAFSLGSGASVPHHASRLAHAPTFTGIRASARHPEPPAAGARTRKTSYSKLCVTHSLGLL